MRRPCGECADVGGGVPDAPCRRTETPPVVGGGVPDAPCRRTETPYRAVKDAGPYGECAGPYGECADARGGVPDAPQGAELPGQRLVARRITLPHPMTGERITVVSQIEL